MASSLTRKGEDIKKEKQRDEINTGKQHHNTSKQEDELLWPSTGQQLYIIFREILCMYIYM